MAFLEEDFDHRGEKLNAFLWHKDLCCCVGFSSVFSSVEGFFSLELALKPNQRALRPWVSPGSPASTDDVWTHLISPSTTSRA